MNHFKLTEEIDEFVQALRNESPAGFVLDALFTADCDYTSAVYWRYFNQVLKTLSRDDYVTFQGVDNGLVLCLNEPFREVVEILKNPITKSIAI